jgi:hypothetical protein
MCRLYRFLMTILTALMVAGPVMAASSDDPAFQQGAADRQQWENWFGSLTGEYRRGAEFWAGQRSLPHPGSCYGPNGQDQGDFTAGCVAAQTRLGPMDARRKSEPSYKAGFNSYPPPLALSQSATPTAINDPLGQQVDQLTCASVVADLPNAATVMGSFVKAHPELKEKVPGVSLPSQNALEVGLFLLKDDYQGWQRGGHAAIDWGKCSAEERAKLGWEVNAALTSSVGISANAPALPVYNVDSNCRRFANTNRQAYDNFFNHCRNEEQRNYDLLKMTWSQATPKNRSVCLQRVSEARQIDMSYTLLEDCISKYEVITAQQRDLEHSQPFRP